MKQFIVKMSGFASDRNLRTFRLSVRADTISDAIAEAHWAYRNMRKPEVLTDVRAYQVNRRAVIDNMQS